MTRNIVFLFFIIFSIFTSCKDNTDKKDASSNSSTKEIKSEVAKELEGSKYISKGINIAKNTGKILKGRLKAAIEKGGITNGINTCNGVAQELMDSMSVVYNSKVKRTTLKLRNTKNAPDQLELEILSQFHTKTEKGEKVKPIVKEFDEYVRFFAPIYIDDVCLKCHGVIGQELKPVVHNKIKSYYPKDEAINYKKGDLRAIWSIIMEK